MTNQIENNTNTLQTVLETINSLPSISNITPERIGAAASFHTQPANTITTGMFAGVVTAQTYSQDPSVSLLRNSKLIAVDINPSYNGEICWIYE